MYFKKSESSMSFVKIIMLLWKGVVSDKLNGCVCERPYIFGLF